MRLRDSRYPLACSAPGPEELPRFGGSAGKITREWNEQRQEEREHHIPLSICINSTAAWSKIRCLLFGNARQKHFAPCAVDYKRPQVVLINNTANVTNEKSSLDCITGPVQPFTFNSSLWCWFSNGFRPKLFRPQRQIVTRCQQQRRLRCNVRWVNSRGLPEDFFPR